MLLLVLVAAFCVTQVLGGSPCPPREGIYPCRCIELGVGRNRNTIISCFKLENSNSLSTVFNNLRGMHIDHFYLYDSFWETNQLGSNADEQRKLPADWITLLHIKEIEIVDSVLSRCFACDAKLSCRNDFMRRFAAINSSSSERICTFCDSNPSAKFSWTACLKKLQHFEFSGSKLSVLRADFFPGPMDELQVLNLTRNQISAIEPKALLYLPKLKKLDLSHNVITKLSNMFGEKNQNLQFIDLRYNLLKSIGTDLLKLAPRLKRLDLGYNRIEYLPKSEWEQATNDLRNIDFTGNNIHCDCRLTWMNSTIHANALMSGICSTPDEYYNMPLRRASRYLLQRCDPDGNIGTRPPKKKSNRPRTSSRS